MNKIILFFFTLLLTMYEVGYSQISTTPSNASGWQPNGATNSITEDANHIYLGGEFTRMIKDGVSGVFNYGAVVANKG